jgi:DUF971 family protein
MSIVPTTIKRASDKLAITWNDGVTNEIPSSLLRTSCPCAECREARGDSSHGTPLTPKRSLLKVVEHSSEESLGLEQVWAIGNYALGMRWRDGHDTGIYPFGLLLQLSRGG